MGSITRKQVVVNAGETVTPPSGLTRDGYTFDSWNMSSDGTGATADLTNILADMTVYAKWIEDIPPVSRVKIVCMGNSLTSGYPYTSDRPNETADIYSWTHTLRDLSGYEVINKGIAGNTSAEMLARFSADVIALSPDYCIIECGTNDADLTNGKSIPLADCKSNIQSMVGLCTSNGITPILAHYSEQVSQLENYYQSISDADYATHASYLNNYVEDVKTFEQGLGYTFLDFTSVVVSGGVLDTTKFGSDFIHPNTDGYTAWGIYANIVLSDL